ncbi:FG-GAP repeat protein [Opitutus terrae PB90-1]|uniref:FG-GAP repeat protein n=2 Tax=Opitutus terrae TaxID=107709 RepID=B1ZQJ3_OPITP|nr:FG-GAP repeat protein [Opitutus terrae PB90-1]
MSSSAHPGSLTRRRVCRVLMLTLLATAFFSAGCDRRPDAPRTRIARAAYVEDLDRYTPVPIGNSFDGKPWLSHVAIVDLDQDGRQDVLACDDKLLSVVWVRQTAPGVFEESTVAAAVPGAVHVEAIDMDGDKDLDLLIACMGEVFPNNDKIGSVVLMENDGHQQFTKHVLVENIARVTDVRAGDFNRDGRLDLAVGQFGYDQGEIRWMENMGNWQFKSRILLSLSGTIHVCVDDFNGDGTQDIAALVSQQWEEIYLFENDGRGNFTNKIIFGSTNEDYGSSGMSLCDLNRDGRPDLLYTNGDGFAYADPGERPWHGVQWLENRGSGFFKFHRIANMAGAYSPVGVDLDRDGDMDIVCTSGFNDWTKPKAVSVVAFINDGRMNFTPHVLAYQPIQLIACDAKDMDGSGAPSIVTVGFYSYPPFDNMSRITLWRPKQKP